MHTFFIFLADLTPWQQRRICAACRAFIAVIDPACDIEPLDLDGIRVGWFFHTSSDEARHRLIVFFTGLTGRVTGEHPLDDPFGRQGEPAVAPDRLLEVAR